MIKTKCLILSRPCGTARPAGTRPVVDRVARAIAIKKPQAISTAPATLATMLRRICPPLAYLGLSVSGTGDRGRLAPLSSPGLGLRVAPSTRTSPTTPVSRRTAERPAGEAQAGVPDSPNGDQCPQRAARKPQALAMGR